MDEAKWQRNEQTGNLAQNRTCQSWKAIYNLMKDVLMTDVWRFINLCIVLKYFTWLYVWQLNLKNRTGLDLVWGLNHFFFAFFFHPFFISFQNEVDSYCSPDITEESDTRFSQWSYVLISHIWPLFFLSFILTTSQFLYPVFLFNIIQYLFVSFYLFCFLTTFHCLS